MVRARARLAVLLSLATLAEAYRVRTTVALGHDYAISGHEVWEWAEEVVETGKVYVFSCDLELPRDNSKLSPEQAVGVRFTGLGLPPDAHIYSAEVAFSAKESASGVVMLEVQGERSGSAQHFLPNYGDVTSRNYTATTVSWSPPSWAARGDTTGSQRVDVTPILQELVGLADWTAGSAVVLRLARARNDTGTNTRIAETGRVPNTQPPTLSVEYEGTSTSAAVRAAQVAAVGLVGGAAAAAVLVLTQRRKQRLGLAEWSATMGKPVKPTARRRARRPVFGSGPPKESGPRFDLDAEMARMEQEDNWEDYAYDTDGAYQHTSAGVLSPVQMQRSAGLV